MSSQSARIKADIAVAAERFPQVSDIVVDGECISFSLSGEEFTASLLGEYGGSCDVYGPDDFEVSCKGSIVDILEVVERKLQGGGEDEIPMPNLGRFQSGESDLHRHSSDEPEASMLFEVAEPGSPHRLGSSLSKLQREIHDLEAMGLSCTVDGVMGDTARVTLALPVPPEISRSTAEAWGFNREQPLRMSLEVHQALYSRSSGERLGDVTFWQEKTIKGFTKLDAGVQLCNMARNFWPRLCGAPVVEPPPDGRPPQRLLDKKSEIIDEAVAMPGVILPLARYMSKRLPCLHEYCVICDEPLVFPPLLRPTVCTRTLCSYSARAFGAAVTGEFSGQNASLEVWDLLVAMAICAGEMDEARMRILFSQQNFPALFAGGSSQPAFVENDEGFRKLKSLLQRLAEYRALKVGVHGVFWLNQVFRDEEQEKDKVDPLLTPLLAWIWDSNRSYILSLTEEDRIEALGTPYQYLLLSAPPEMEDRFQALKKRYGSEFCFHGSGPANWHCILRQGLKNASGTVLMTAGQAHGPGIYLARDSMTSASYSSGNMGGWAGMRPRVPKNSGASNNHHGEVTGQRVHDPDSLIMLAICEVAQVSSLRKSGTIWVCPDEAAVVTRFFLVYRTKPIGCVPPVSLDEGKLKTKLYELTSRWTQS